MWPSGDRLVAGGAGYDLLEAEKNGSLYPLGDVPTLARRIRDALALPAAEVERTNQRILADWGYEASWRSILRAADGSR